MSFSTILSAAIDGLGVELVRVEADVSNGGISVIRGKRSRGKGEDCDPEFRIRLSGKAHSR